MAVVQSIYTGFTFRCRLRFWVDIIAWLPFDYVIIEIAYPPCFASNTARWWSLLKLLRLVRSPPVFYHATG